MSIKNYVGYHKVVTNQIEELKRLQKEIDEANAICEDYIISQWGKGTQEGKDKADEAAQVIPTNQLKIKQIIESL